MRSAGLLPYRQASQLQVLIAHPGGPYFARRHEGWWTIVKGVVEWGEDPAATAAREFEEETGWPPPPVPWIGLGETRLRGGKRVIAWAVEADLDPLTLRPGTFALGGATHPEIDRVRWATVTEARRLLNPAQTVFLDRLLVAIRHT